MKKNEGLFFDAQAMFICDQTNLIIQDVNQAMLSNLGLSKSELIGKYVYDLFKKVEVSNPILNLHKDSNIDLSDFFYIKSKQGVNQYVQFSAHLINYLGKPSKLFLSHDVKAFIIPDISIKDAISSRVGIPNFPLAEIEWNSEMKVIRWSSKAEELFGWEEQDAKVIYNFIDKIIYDEDEEFVNSNLRFTIEAHETTFSIVNRNLTKDGKIIYVEWNNSLLYDIDGNFVSMYSLCHDVSDRMQAVDEAERSMKSYRDLFDSITDAIYLITEEGTIIEANHGVKNIYGYNRSEVIGKGIQFLAPSGKFSEDRISQVKEVLKSQNIYKYEGWGKKKNGEIFPSEVLINKGSYLGEEAFIVIERDISERFEAEEALKKRESLFRELFNASPIGIALLNEHREIELINSGFENIFGYTTDEVKGLEIDKLIVPDEFSVEANSLTKSKKVVQTSGKRRTKDGEIIDVLIYALPVIVENRIIALYGLYVDVTEQIKAEESITKSLREKEVLLAEIHHRVKNNLAVITGLLELKSFTTESEDAKSVLKDSQMRIHSIALAHEKLYQNEDFSEIRMDIYLKELTDIIEKSFRVKDVEISIVFDLDNVKMLVTQAVPCGLLLNELLTNSFKYAFEDKKTGKIKVSLKRKSEATVLFTIEDNGIGLDKSSYENESSGLGLKLIRTLAKQLDAETKVISKNGSKFIFEFNKNDVD